MPKPRKTKGAGRTTGRKGAAKPKARPKPAAKPKTRPKASKPAKPAPKAVRKVAPKPVPKPVKAKTAAPVRRVAPTAAPPTPPPPEPEETREPEPVVPAPPPTRPIDGDLRAEVEVALKRSGYDEPDPEQIDVVTRVAMGYREGPADAPPAMAAYANRAVADGFAEIFATGDLSPVVGRRMARPVVRATIDFDLRQLGPDETGDAEREVLMGICLGLWDPDRDTFAQRDGLAAFVCRWYRAGLREG